MIGGFALCVIAGAAKAQTPEAKRAVVEISAGQYGGSGVLVDVQGDRYEGRTAAHVIGQYKTIGVEVDGVDYTATITGRKYDSTADIAAFTFRSNRRHNVVRIAGPPKMGERVWSAGYPGFSNGLVTRQGSRVATQHGDLTVSYRVASGDSGSPLFTNHGVAAIIGGTVGGQSYATECKLFGRRGGGGCFGGRCGPDEGTTDPGEIIDTPVGDPEPVLLPPVIDEIAEDVASIESVLTEPEPEPNSILPVLLILGAAVGVVLFRHFKN
jgi:hypothetical protein